MHLKIRRPKELKLEKVKGYLEEKSEISRIFGEIENKSRKKITDIQISVNFFEIKNKKMKTIAASWGKIEKVLSPGERWPFLVQGFLPSVESADICEIEINSFEITSENSMASEIQPIKPFLFVICQENRKSEAIMTVEAVNQGEREVKARGICVFYKENRPFWVERDPREILIFPEESEIFCFRIPLFLFKIPFTYKFLFEP